MKIYIKDIRPEGIEVLEKFPAEQMGLRPQDGIHFTRPLELKARVERVQNTVLGNVQVEGIYDWFCARCLDPLEGKLSQEINLDYPINPSTECIEMDEDIRQEIILNLPLRVLCKDDCKGICYKCGANLNIEACKCKK